LSIVQSVSWALATRILAGFLPLGPGPSSAQAGQQPERVLEKSTES
jgi:hypothetical protein